MGVRTRVREAAAGLVLLLAAGCGGGGGAGQPSSPVRSEAGVTPAPGGDVLVTQDPNPIVARNSPVLVVNPDRAPTWWWSTAWTGPTSGPASM